jgi:RNA polymerase sigma-70 factor, ECF subfamily
VAFSVSYRMLGSVSDAEDIAQEALMRLHAAEESVNSPVAFVTTVATRLAIDQFRSARVRRETYPGTWLPEPIVGEQHYDRFALTESISMAVLVLLEKLSPTERAVFVLREAFEYDYDEIAGIVGKSATNCRQIFARARAHVDSGRLRFEASREKRDAIAREFLLARERGAPEDVGRLLASDVSFYGDGGGKAMAVAHPVNGAGRVARLMLGFFAKGKALGGRMQFAEVNGEPGALLLESEGKIVSAMAIEIAEGRVHAVRNVVNPDKLTHLGPVSELARIGSPKELR